MPLGVGGLTSLLGSLPLRLDLRFRGSSNGTFGRLNPVFLGYYKPSSYYGVPAKSSV